MDDEWGFDRTHERQRRGRPTSRGAWLVDDEGKSRGQRASSIRDDAQDSCWIDQARSLSARSQQGVVGGHRTSTDQPRMGCTYIEAGRTIRLRSSLDDTGLFIRRAGVTPKLGKGDVCCRRCGSDQHGRLAGRSTASNQLDGPRSWMTSTAWQTIWRSISALDRVRGGQPPP
jgi:hypothetical protein